MGICSIWMGDNHTHGQKVIRESLTTCLKLKRQAYEHISGLKAITEDSAIYEKQRKRYKEQGQVHIRAKLISYIAV